MYIFYKYRNILSRYVNEYSINLLQRNWSDRSRHYHNVDHLNNVIKYIEKNAMKRPVIEIEALIVAAFFHDGVYDVKSPLGHEEASIKLFNDS